MGKAGKKGRGGQGRKGKGRGNGEGSVYQRKDGRWVGQYAVRAVDGKLGYRYIYGKDRAEVAKRLTKAMADRDEGLFFDAGNQTVGEYLERWLSHSVKDSVRQRTVENYAYVLGKHVVPALGRLKLKALAPDHLQALYRTKLDAGLSARTVRLVHVVLHSALKQAVVWGHVPRNAADGARPPRPVRREISPLSPEEARALLRAAQDERLEALYVLALSAGLRRGELLGLRWEDVDLDCGVLRVRRQLTRTKEGLTFTPPKTAKGRRRVRLTRAAVEALGRHRGRQAEERAALPAGLLAEMGADPGLVFASEAGTPLDPDNLAKRSFKPLLKRAGLPDARFHDLRHTCATLLLGKGVHPKVVQEMLGHATVSITLDTYSHLLPDMQEGAVGAMEDALGDNRDGEPRSGPSGTGEGRDDGDRDPPDEQDLV